MPRLGQLCCRAVKWVKTPVSARALTAAAGGAGAPSGAWASRYPKRKLFTLDAPKLMVWEISQFFWVSYCVSMP